MRGPEGPHLQRQQRVGSWRQGRNRSEDPSFLVSDFLKANMGDGSRCSYQLSIDILFTE